MASFDVNMSTVIKAEGGYQNDPGDSANFCGGVNAGTKYGVSAIGYKNAFGKCPSPDTMRNLTIDTAKQVGKVNYWDKINGDKVLNQSVADMMFSYIWGSGASEISSIKAVANAIYGKRFSVENDNPITDKEVEVINSLDQEKFWLALREFRINFFHNLVKKDPNKYGKYLEGWLNRMSKRTFTPTNSVSKKK